ncbi:NADPH oxidase 4-like isoform X1 [Bradysia coprophila]|uniref:NADPH oxidase 4-like isoform X1 n=1 Tax=Bradysia coprophila TaxID=38358 RepID=UPI00187DD579|nr:NADPH oxidase 4-like isoform X1 [Bradysia coprophila]
MCVNLKIFNCTKWFFVKYIFLFLWILSLFLVFCKSYKFYYDEPEYERLKKIVGHGLCISRATAPVLYFLVAISILPVCRTFNQIIHCILRRISTFCLTFYLENIKVLHMTFSIGLVLVSVIHAVAHTINAKNFVQFYDWQHLDLNWARGTNDSYLRLIFATPTGFSGCFMLFALIVMWISSTRPIRHYYYNCYLALHHLFMLMVLVLLYFHSLGFYLLLASNIIKFQTNVDLPCAHDVNATDETCHNKEQFSSGEHRGWIWPTIGLFIYLADAFVRFIKRNANDVVLHNMQKFPGKAVFLRLGLNKSKMNIRPGQYILLQCLNISSLEWHPFTVTKVPTKTDHTFTLLIATRGDWTMELYGKMSSRLCFQKHQTIKTYHKRPPLKFLVDGPFPSPLESIFQHKITLCVAGGVGITPFISVLNDLLYKLRKEPSRIHLTWVVTHVEQILWFSSIFEQLMEKLWQQNAPDRLDIQLYVTKNFNAQKIAKIFHQESSFVKSRIHSGRPNWCSLFSYLDFLYQKQEVAVFSSGPKSLNAEIQKMCHEKNKLGYNYWFLHQGFH